MNITRKKWTDIVTLSSYSSMIQREIAAEYSICLKAVSSIIKLYRKTSSVKPRRKEKCGRHSLKDGSMLVRDPIIGPQTTRIDLNKDLAGAGLLLVIVPRSLKKKKLLTENDEAAWLCQTVQ